MLYQGHQPGQRGSRGYAQKRSPSSQDEEDNDVMFEQREGSAGSTGKRRKNQHVSDRGYLSINLRNFTLSLGTFIQSLVRFNDSFL